MALTLLLQKEGGAAAQGIFSCMQIRELEIRVQHIALVTAVAFRASAALVTALQVGWWEGVLHVSYCSMKPWLAGQLLSGPLPGSARYWLLQPGAHSSAISLLKGKNKPH